MLVFAERYCIENYPLYQYEELLTGEENHIAQSLYEKLGYTKDAEIHLSKPINREDLKNIA